MKNKFTEEELKSAEEYANGESVYGWRASHKAFLAGIEYQKGMGLEQIKKAYDAGWDDGRSKPIYGGLKYICKVSDFLWK